jgi:FkbM family methyltransferase
MLRTLVGNPDFARPLRRLGNRFLPARWLHAYRVLVHVILYPAEADMRIIASGLLPPNSVSVDVGCNVGLYASILARRTARTIAFEPHPGNAAYLRELRIRRCEIVEAAVSDASGRQVLRVPVEGDVEMHALGAIRGNETHVPSTVQYDVEVVTLDSFLPPRLNASERIGFIKIDVEGHELDVLRGANKIIDAHRPILLVETAARSEQAKNELFRFLVPRGYCAKMTTDGRSLSNAEPSSSATNMLFMPDRP